MKKLPDRIYIIDPYDEDGDLLPNTEDVCWCQDAVGEVNVPYIAAQAVTDALAALRADMNKLLFQKRHRLPAEALLDAAILVDATMAKLGLPAPKQEGGRR